MTRSAAKLSNNTRITNEMRGEKKKKSLSFFPSSDNVIPLGLTIYTEPQLVISYRGTCTLCSVIDAGRSQPNPEVSGTEGFKKIRIKFTAY